MNILVTGGSGNVGQGVVERLVCNGHQVRVVDWQVRDPIPGVEYAQCDITSYANLREQARGMKGIIHLAAFPYPGAAPGPEIFRVNCAGTYNVFEAAAAEGIRRVSIASSINALGFNFGVKSFPIEYFPIDEEHPTFTSDPYSFSKETVESIARYYWRRDGISSTCLRMPFVYTMSSELAQWAHLFAMKYHQFFDRLSGQPEPEQRALVGQMLTGLEKQRAERTWEKPLLEEGNWNAEDYFNDPAMMAHFGYTDFWAIISVQDAAQAFEKSLLVDFEGSHPLYVTEANNSAGIESEALLRVFYPEVKARKSPIAGTATLVSYARAHQLIGYQPEHSVE
jgi:hypothetical protein